MGFFAGLKNAFSKKSNDEEPEVKVNNVVATIKDAEISDNTIKLKETSGPVRINESERMILVAFMKHVVDYYNNEGREEYVKFMNSTSAKTLKTFSKLVDVEDDDYNQLMFSFTQNKEYCINKDFINFVNELLFKKFVDMLREVKFAGVSFTVAANGNSSSIMVTKVKID